MSMTYTLVKLHKPEFFELHKGNWYLGEEWLAPGVPVEHVAVSLKEDVLTFSTFTDDDFTRMATHLVKWIGEDEVIITVDNGDFSPPYYAITPLVPLDEVKKRLGLTVEDITTYKCTGDRYDVFPKE
jgi:hypothetical protein